jgi:hypothetical protein
MDGLLQTPSQIEPVLIIRGAWLGAPQMIKAIQLVAQDKDWSLEALNTLARVADDITNFQREEDFTKYLDSHEATGVPAQLLESSGLKQKKEKNSNGRPQAPDLDPNAFQPGSIPEHQEPGDPTFLGELLARFDRVEQQLGDLADRIGQEPREPRTGPAPTPDAQPVAQPADSGRPPKPPKPAKRKGGRGRA